MHKLSDAMFSVIIFFSLKFVNDFLLQLKQKVSLAEKTVDPIFEEYRTRLKNLTDDCHNIHLSIYRQHTTAKGIF